MKIKVFKPLTLLTCLSLFIFGCKKAGMGGQYEVSVHVKHHSNLIPGAKLFVKYNAKEFPGIDEHLYELSETCGTIGEAKGHANIKNLNYGFYYFYSVGYDSSISQKVKGGMGLHIKFSERKKDIKLKVPVAE